MGKDINRQLAHYSNVNLQNDLKNLENDVNRRLRIDQAGHRKPKARIEQWFGMPASVSASAIAMTLVVGIIMGTMQVNPEIASG